MHEVIGGADWLQTPNLTDLFSALYAGKVPRVQQLLKQGIDLEMKDKNQRTALILAAESANVEFVQMLLARGATIDATEQDGYTALIIAATAGNHELV